MEESFRVGATLALKSNIPEALLRFSEEFERFDRRVKESTEGLGAFTKAISGISRAGRGMERLQVSMERISRAGSGLADLGRAGAALERLGADGKGISRVASAIKRLSQVSLGMAAVSMDDYAQALGRVASHERAMRSVADSVRTLGRGSVGRPMPGDREPSGRASSSARRSGHDVWHNERHAIGDIGMAGVAAGAAGGGGLAFFGRSVGAGMDVMHERAMMLADNRVTEKQADAAIDSAYNATKLAPGTKWSVNAKAILDLKNVTGDLGDAEKSLPAFANYMAVLQAVDRAKGDKGRGGDAAFAGAKAMDILGEMMSEDKDPVTGEWVRHIDPKLLTDRLAKLARVASGTTGRVDTNDYLRFAKTGAIPGALFNDEMKYELLPSMLMTMGASRVGTAFQSLSQVTQGERITDKTYDEMMAAGLADVDTVKTVRNRTTGKLKKIRQHDRFFDEEDMIRNPVLWAEKSQKQMEKRGFDTVDKQIKEIQKFSQRSSYARLLGEILKDLPAIRREQQTIQHQRPDLLAHYMKEDPSYALTQFDAAWEKFMATLGSDMMKPALTVLDLATKGLNKLADWAKENPKLGEIIGTVAGSLFTLAAAIGVLSMGLMIYIPAFKAAKAILSGKAVEAAAEGAGSRSVMRLAPAALGAVGTVGAVAGGMLAAGALAGSMNGPMVDDFGRVIGNWGGTPPPPLAPKQGSSSDPVNVRVVDHDGMSAGVFSSQARRMNRPPDGPTVPNVNLSPGGAYFGSGWAPP